VTQSPGALTGHERIADAASARETFFVEAGAGTGKTTALVGRVVALVSSGIPIERIAAVTFTERAAAELRDRVREGLETERAKGNDPHGYMKDALESLDRAQMSTIHAFCQALLRIFAAEAGVAPDFQVLDEITTERRQEDTWREFLEDLAGDSDAEERIDRVLRLGLSTGDLAAFADAMVRANDLARKLEANMPEAAEPTWPDLDHLANKLESTGYRFVPRDDAMRGKFVKLADLLARLASASAREREVVLANAGELKFKGAGQQGNWGGKEGKEQVVEIGQDVMDQLARLLGELRSKALAGFVPIVVRFARADEARRCREGTLTFNDLIVQASELLANSEPARVSLRNQYDRLLIDEFQDTDPLQVQIARAFATDPETGAVEHGRLFLVGDPKQSIYRFRGADMATFADVRAWMEESGATFVDLDVNRRSRPAILEWVNAVFETVIGDGTNAGVQPPYRAIHPARETDLKGPSVGVIGEAYPGVVAPTRAREVADTAALCRTAVDLEPWQVQVNGEVRNARYGDIAILIPTRGNLTGLERALSSRRIPYRVEGGSLVFRTQEIRDIINCLSAIDNPSDEVAIAGALRSPAFACSDRELVEFKQSGGRFNYLHPGNEQQSGHVAGSLAVLKGYFERKHHGSLAALVEGFCSERGLVEIGVLHDASRNSFRRARYMIQSARDFEASGPQSLRSFISWIERQTVGKVYNREGADLDDDEDSVRIMTIHASKGLEFPIVFMAGLSAEPRGTQSEMILRNDLAGRFAFCLGAAARRFTLGDYADLQALAAQHERAEQNRTLYVAATRARDHLVVSLYRKEPSSSPADTLARAGAESAAGNRLTVPDVAPSHILPFEGLTLEIDPEQTADTLVAQRRRVLGAARAMNYTSATALKRLLPADGDDDRPGREDDTEPWSRGRARTRLGRAVHAAIQGLPMGANDGLIASFSRAQAVAEAVPHLEADVTRLVTWVVKESDAWKRAIGAGRALREVPFALRDGFTVLEGFIDLVIETPEGLEVVDWKTDRINEGEVEGRLEDYKLQAGLYVHGLEQATGRLVTGVTYVFAEPRIERPFDDPRGLARSAIAHLRAASPAV